MKPNRLLDTIISVIKIRTQIKYYLRKKKERQNVFMKNKIKNSFFIFNKAILFSGIINIMIGEFYTLLVAGLPYQDPPLELQIQYSINQGVGNVLTGIGFRIVILGIILSIISKLYRILKKYV